MTALLNDVKAFEFARGAFWMREKAARYADMRSAFVLAEKIRALSLDVKDDGNKHRPTEE